VALVVNVGFSFIHKETFMRLIPRLTATALLVGAAAFAQSALAQQTIKIGALNPYSGPMAL
jgi:hypothetical protein